MSALLAWLWQALVLVGVLELLLRTMPRLNAATRHLIWWAALAGVVILGGAYALGGVWTAEVQAATRLVGAPVASAPLLTLPAAPSWLTWCLVASWMAAVLHGIGRIGRGMRHVAALRVEAAPISDATATRLRHWSQTRSAGRRARLCVTDREIAACAVGFRRPVILVSRRLVDTLDAEVLDQVVMHEQAHLDRFDDWLRLVQALVTAVAGVNPAVRFIARRIDLEREAACDDRVVSVTGAAAGYASCLADAAAAALARIPAAVPAVVGDASSPSARSLRMRIVRLLDPRPDRGRRIVRSAMLTAAVWLAAFVAVAPQLPFVVVFVHASPLQALLIGPASPAGPPIAAVVPRAEPEWTAVARPAPAAQQPAHSPAALEATRVAADSFVSEPPVIDGQLAGPAHDVPAGVTSHDAVPAALATFGPAVQDAPPGSQAVVPAPSLSGRPDPSFVQSVSSVGRNTAATTRKAGVSLAGTVARAGKALGKVF